MGAKTRENGNLSCSGLPLHERSAKIIFAPQDVAQFGKVLGSGPRERGFKSRHPDHSKRQLNPDSLVIKLPGLVLIHTFMFRYKQRPKDNSLGLCLYHFREVRKRFILKSRKKQNYILSSRKISLIYRVIHTFNSYKGYEMQFYLELHFKVMERMTLSMTKKGIRDSTDLFFLGQKKKSRVFLSLIRCFIGAACFQLLFSTVYLDKNQRNASLSPQKSRNPYCFQRVRNRLTIRLFKVKHGH